MTAIIFRTPGTLDMRAFTTMGMSAKPSTDRPIGVFGTGLKYAVAVLVRMGARFEVHTGGHRYWFETAPVDFRGAEFQQVVMRRDAWTGGDGWRLGRRVKLPFTTQYGRNWATWMAFRELYANTLDEGGDTFEDTNPDYSDASEMDPTSTYIIVEHDEFTEAYRNRADVFLGLGDRTLRAEMPGLEIHHGTTQRMFYQGLRALDIGKPAMFTYNVTAPQHLTEDRQLGREWQVRSLVADTIAQCEDEGLIRSVVTAAEGLWEHGLAPNSWVAPSDAFHRVMASRPRGVGGSWGGYYGGYDRRPEAQRDPWQDAPRPWRVDGGDVVDDGGTALLSKPFGLHDGHWQTLAGRIVRMANEWAAMDPGDWGAVPDLPALPRAMVAGDLYGEHGRVMDFYQELARDGVTLLYNPFPCVHLDPSTGAPWEHHVCQECGASLTEDGDDIPF